MHNGWVAIAAFLLLMQGIGTLLISESDSEQYILFGCDGGGMVLATLLMLSFYLGKETQLYKGGSGGAPRYWRPRLRGYVHDLVAIS